MYSKKRIKIFNKILKEFLEEYKKIVNKDYYQIVKVKEMHVLTNFQNEIKNNVELFLECDKKVFGYITLCKDISLDKLEKEIETNIWQYLHNLYIITILESERKEEFANRSKERLRQRELSLTRNTNTNSIGNLLGSIMGNPGLSNLIEDISKEVSKKLEGKDLSHIDPNELLSNLLSGNGETSGINFNEIIHTTKEKFQDRVDSGEIDVKSLQNIANTFSNTLGK